MEEVHHNAMDHFLATVTMKHVKACHTRLPIIPHRYIIRCMPWWKHIFGLIEEKAKVDLA